MTKGQDPRRDLNLFVVFDAVMDEGSLSKAGRRLGISQPAVSHALRRLRAMTGGEQLFERTGRGVRPTAHALALAKNVRPALDSLRATLNRISTPFDPKTSQQTFLLDFPFGIDSIVVPELSARVRDCPNITFRIAGGRARDVLGGLRYGETWLALDYEEATGDDYRSQLLFEDRFVIISRRGHPRISEPLRLDDLETLDHVVVGWAGDYTRSPSEVRLDRLGIRRRVTFSVPTIAALPFIVEKQDLVATATEKVARYYSRSFAIDIHPLPPAVPLLPVYMVWHHSFDNHEAHVWLRKLLAEILAAL